MGRERVMAKLTDWLRQGMSPRRLALTLALGFTIGCVPVVGMPTLVCAALAVALGLNIPAIQAANYVAMPFQFALIVPFVKLGSRILVHLVGPAAASGELNSPVWKLAAHAGGMAGQAMLGWLLVAVPAAALLTAGFYAMLKRVPALRIQSQGCD
jgi:hypothetical protein